MWLEKRHSIRERGVLEQSTESQYEPRVGPEHESVCRSYPTRNQPGDQIEGPRCTDETDPEQREAKSRRPQNNLKEDVYERSEKT